jgi:tetratricopeptide (TPR) repeat protein
MTRDSEFNQLIAAGLAASQENRTPAALDLFGQASALVPDSGVPHFLIGSEHAGAGNLEEAEAAFANAVLLAPDFLLARYQLGLLQFTSKRAAVALITWQPLFALPESDALGHFVRGFAALAQDEFQDALGHFRAGLERNGSNPPLSTDILQVVAALEALPRPAEAAPEPPAGPGHVLLSGYSRGLH